MHRICAVMTAPAGERQRSPLHPVLLKCRDCFAPRQIAERKSATFTARVLEIERLGAVLAFEQFHAISRWEKRNGNDLTKVPSAVRWLRDALANELEDAAAKSRIRQGNQPRAADRGDRNDRKRRKEHQAAARRLGEGPQGRRGDFSAYMQMMLETPLRRGQSMAGPPGRHRRQRRLPPLKKSPPGHGGLADVLIFDFEARF
jgi:hypothetical protein